MNTFITGICAMASELVPTYSNISEEGQNCLHLKRKPLVIVLAVGSWSMRVRRTSPVLTVSAALFSGKMAVSGQTDTRH